MTQATTSERTHTGNPRPANTTAPAPGHVTTGPIRGSRKVYSSPEGHADIRVPFREIALDPSANEPPLRVSRYLRPLHRPGRAD